MNDKRIKVKVTSTASDPQSGVLEISIDGEVIEDLCITRMEVVLDGDTQKNVMRLDFPTFELELDDDALPIRPVNGKWVSRIRNYLRLIDSKSD